MTTFNFIRSALNVQPLVSTAVAWADDGRLDENVQDESLVLESLADLDFLISQNGNSQSSLENEIVRLLLKTKSWACASLRGCGIAWAGSREILDKCDWHGAMPVIDSELCFTGHWIYWDLSDEDYLNFNDEAAISVGDAAAAGLWITDGYATQH